MAPRCCKDSVAWKIAAIFPAEPTDGMRVECRWTDLCLDGYAVYRNGVWEYGERSSDAITYRASPAQTAKRAERIKEILK